ncbi:transporter associated domain-containing protein [Treponema phagedenis]|nr:transporter associated domain-containing protein [Treponema phagedenis]
MVLEKLGSIPEKGVTVHIDGWLFTVLEVQANRIEKIKIELFEGEE